MPKPEKPFMERSVLNDKFREELAFLCEFQKGHFDYKVEKKFH